MYSQPYAQSYDPYTSSRSVYGVENGALPATNFLHTQSAGPVVTCLSCCGSLLFLGILSYMTTTALTDTGFNVATKWTVTQVPVWFKSTTDEWQYGWIGTLVVDGFFLILSAVLLYLAINAVRRRDRSCMQIFAAYEGICAGCGCCCGILCIVGVVVTIMGVSALSNPTTLCGGTSGDQLTTVTAPSATSTADCIALATKLQTPMKIALCLQIFNLICSCCCWAGLSSAASKFAIDTRNVFDAQGGGGFINNDMY